MVLSMSFEGILNQQIVAVVVIINSFFCNLNLFST
ncbi:hypothetical protein AB751O23_AA_00100 [Chlamydiales bacterium SCGC AB-751-O23]|nr:hypothetical protein AB751O23_AA_00100 [Chlamydiales bacterium SCGC AB-751-O23]